jgi:hypothetical protein
VATSFLRRAELETGRRIRRHDAGSHAEALRQGVAVATQDADVLTFDAVSIIRV